MIKFKSRFLLFVVFLLLNSTIIFSQNDLISGGPVFNGIDFGTVDMMTPQQHEQIWKTIDSASKALNLAKDTAKDVLFSLPIKLKNGITDYGFYTIVNYVDHDSTYPDNLLDYNCGNLSYDWASGYNHQGTDFCSWPFSWLRMQNDVVEVIAAAPGTIIYKGDGNFDQSCSINSNTWNAVYVQHADGSIAWYGHLKKFSLTSKAVGDNVAEGEYLGIMGSSGCSTGPHLHFEVYNSASSLIDPFQGTCNDMNSNSWWQNQLPYKDAGINRFQTCNHAPVMPDCPGIETPNETDYFYTNDTLFVVSWFRNLSTDDEADITIYRPDNSVYYTLTWTSSWPFYQAAWLYYYFILDAGDPSGLWHAEVNYKGQLYIKPFYYNSGSIIPEISGQEFSITQDENTIYLNFLNSDYASKQVTWTLFDATGRTMKTGILETSEKNIISISSISNGIYFLMAETQNGKYFSKVFKL
jgi:hypothetical protein